MKLESSPLAIRNHQDELIGVVGFNPDISYLEQFSKYIDQIASTQKRRYLTEADRFGEIFPREDIRDAGHDYVVSRR